MACDLDVLLRSASTFVPEICIWNWYKVVRSLRNSGLAKDGCGGFNEGFSTEQIVRSFHSCGVTVAADGSEDHLIHCLKPGNPCSGALDILRDLQQTLHNGVEMELEEGEEPESEDDEYGVVPLEEGEENDVVPRQEGEEKSDSQQEF